MVFDMKWYIPTPRFDVPPNGFLCIGPPPPLIDPPPGESISSRFSVAFES